MNNQDLPAVLILGIDTPIGLTMIRELAEYHVPVYGVATSKEGIGLYSRYLKKGFIHSGDNDSLIELLNHIAAEFNVPYLMTISEQRILFLQEHSHLLKGITALIPKNKQMLSVLDKSYVYEVAEKIGINIPKSYIIEDQNNLDSVELPVILKWANPNKVLSCLSTQGIPFLKCEYCYTQNELTTSLQRYSLIKQYPLVQSYCVGIGLGHMIYMHKGEAILKFQHVRIHESPPEGGVSSLCESIPLTKNRDLFEKSIDLLRQLDWEGPAMVEYRYDERTGESRLMEINGRFWGSLPLAYYSNAHFVWTHYCVQALKRNLDNSKPINYIRCMFFIPEFKRFIIFLFKKEKIQDKSKNFNLQQEFSVFLKHYIDLQYFYVFSWKDPMPFVMDIWNLTINRVLKSKYD